MSIKKMYIKLGELLGVSCDSCLEYRISETERDIVIRQYDEVFEKLNLPNRIFSGTFSEWLKKCLKVLDIETVRLQAYKVNGNGYHLIRADNIEEAVSILTENGHYIESIQYIYTTSSEVLKNKHE